MTRPNEQELRRWSRGGHTTPEEARATELFAAARELPPIAPEALTRVEVGISAKLSLVGTARWAKVLFASAAIGGGSLALAALSRWTTPDAESMEPTAAPPVRVELPGEAPSIDATSKPALPPRVEVPVEAPTVETELAPVALITPGPTQRRESRPASPVAVAVPTSPAGGGLAREAALLQEALRKLSAGDSERALDLLDTRAREFPSGQLASEADVARVDALVAGDRGAEALALMNGWSVRYLESLPRSAELGVLRAELRAEAGQCRAALETFEEIIAREAARGPGLVERAWRGRAVCRRALGDQLGAERDAAEYLTRFPRGTWADDMRALAAP